MWKICHRCLVLSVLSKKWFYLLLTHLLKENTLLYMFFKIVFLDNPPVSLSFCQPTTLLLFLQTSIIQETCSMFSLSHCCHHCELVTNNMSVKYFIFTVESTFGRWIQELVIILIYLRQVITLLPMQRNYLCEWQFNQF